MKIKLFTASAAAAVLMLAACTDKVDFTQESLQEAAAAAADDGSIRFGTYMGTNVQTRAGSTGAIDTDKLKTSGYGFGVFAYYTGTSTYDATQYNNADPKKLANFMYNQKVEWKTESTYEGYVNGSGTGASAGAWIYTPIKYWPNEISSTANTADDDQDNDAANNQATGSGDFGGNVSYFAYAPYVDAAISETNVGIVAINGATDLTGTAPSSPSLGTGGQKIGDPIITYVIDPDGNNVDLLWGTAGENGVGVTGAPNVGSNEGTATPNTSSVTTESDYTKKHVENLLKTYRVNTDLTKQKTNGTINFNFKHALAKVGGSSDVANNDDEPTHGLMVILDLDDFKGAEEGGELQTTKTKVTINSVSLTNDFNNDGDASDSENSISETIANQGIFNLATGQWFNATSVSVTKGATTKTGVINHTIYPVNNATTGNATLNPAIAEYYDSNNKNGLYNELGKNINGDSDTKNYDAFFGNSAPFAGQIGVQTSKRLAVYGSEANPLVFIPGTQPALKITVDYFVRTKDANLQKGYSEVRQVISKIIQFNKPVELNKQYNLLMHLGLTSVKFTATVSDWELSTVDDDNDPSTDEVIDLTVVNVPINVAGVASWSVATSANQTFASNVTADQNLGAVTINLSDGTPAYTSTSSNYSNFNVSASSGVTASMNSSGELLVKFDEANNTTADKTGTVTVTYGTSAIDIPVTQSSASAITVATSVSTKIVTLTATNSDTSTDINLTSGGYSVKVYSDSECNTEIKAVDSGTGVLNWTDNGDGTVTFQTAGTYYIKVTINGTTNVTGVSATVS